MAPSGYDWSSQTASYHLARCLFLSLSWCIWDTHVTIPLIRDRFFPGNYDAAYHHVHRYWRWFLVRISDDTSPHVFKVQGIMNYPRTYFIDAHKPEHMRFFYHFVESMKAYDNREKRFRPRREGDQDDQQPLPTQLVVLLDDPLEELSEEEELQEKETDGVKEPEESGVPESDTALSDQGVPPAEPDEGQMKPNESHEQSPPLKPNDDNEQSSHRLFWYISCVVAAVVIGTIIAYIVISRRE